MGGVYLAYSAYFVSETIETVRILLDSILNIMNVGLAYVIIRNSFNSLQILWNHLNSLNDNDSYELKNVIKLKFRMLRQFTILVISYFIYEITINGVLRYIR